MLTSSRVGSGRSAFLKGIFRPFSRAGKPHLFGSDHDSINNDTPRRRSRWTHKAISAAALGLAVTVGFVSGSGAETKLIRARSAILADLASGEVIYEQNPADLIAPASLTKVLTLYLAFEAIEEGRVHWMDSVHISPNAVSAGPVRMGLKAGTIVPFRDLIYGTAVISGNDAAIAVAEHVGGSEVNFVRMMNIKAKQLGMWNSNFVNPNGLPAAGQVTTAKDILTLSMAYLKRFPQCLEIHSLQKFTYNNCTRSNANRLLGSCPGVDGLKTGFVNASGYNLAATGMREGRRLVAVVLGASSPGLRKTETTRLLEYGFEGTPLTLVIMAKESRPRSTAPKRVIRTASSRTGTIKTCVVKGKKTSAQADRSQIALSGKRAIKTAGPGVKLVQPKPVKTIAVANSKTGLPANVKQSGAKAGRVENRVQAVQKPARTNGLRSAAVKPAENISKKKQPGAETVKQKPQNKPTSPSKSTIQTVAKAKPAIQCSIKKPARMAN